MLIHERIIYKGNLCSVSSWAQKSDAVVNLHYTEAGIMSVEDG